MATVDVLLAPPSEIVAFLRIQYRVIDRSYMLLDKHALMCSTTSVVYLITCTCRCCGITRTRCCIATFLNSACAIAIVYSKVTKVRGKLVEEEYYQMATARVSGNIFKSKHQC